MNTGIVVELGILTDWLRKQETKAPIGRRLTAMEDSGLGLNCKKLRKLLSC